MKRYAFLAILAAACAVIGLSSYRIGHDSGMAAAAASAGQVKAATQPADTPAEPPSSRPPAELLSLKQKLRHSYAACPSAERDWILRGQTATLLATMSTAEVKQWFDELMARHRAGRAVKAGEPDMILASDLLREWGRRDPVAASMMIAEMPLYTDGRMAAFQDWLLRDPRAVERWMNSGGDAVPKELRKAWLSERVKSDPIDAIQQLTKLPPEDRESSLLEWSTSFALLPGERKALLDAVREEPALLRRCAGRVAAALADRSVETAYAFVDTLDLPEELATSIDDGIFVKWGMKDPQVAFAEWAKQQPTRLPENFLYVLDNWALNSPGAEQAIKWLDTVQAGPVKEQIQAHFIADLADGDRFEQALRMCLSMENREEGKRQAVRVIEILKQKFPDMEKELSKALKEEGLDLR
ncbi:MAG: hypothetical protein EOP83_16745 [Verrucomicrobiaceae bacterium]|nr:MAG: hypothetical protein EOP83_16745 [Verrucomicrobiaceae bacterium]